MLTFCAGMIGRRERGSPGGCVSERPHTRGGEEMVVRLAGYAVDIRLLREHVPAVADRSLPAVTVALKAGLYTFKASGADGRQRRLFSRR